MKIYVNIGFSAGLQNIWKIFWKKNEFYFA